MNQEWLSSTWNMSLIIQIGLQNAIIATPMPPVFGTPLVQDIYRALTYKHGPTAQPIQIWNFPPDFVIQFATSHIKDMVLSQNTIEGINFRPGLTPWHNAHRSEHISWNTKVRVILSGIPPQGFKKHFIKPLISPYCDIRTSSFDHRSGECTITGFAQSISSIPNHTYLGISYRHDHGTHIKSFRINIHTEACSDEPAENDEPASTSDLHLSTPVDPGDHFRRLYIKTCIKD